MKIFDSQFAHAVSAGSPYQDTVIPFSWEREFSEIKEDEVIIFTESSYDISKQINSRKKILWVLESPAFISQGLISDIILSHDDYYKILTHDDRLMNLPNAVLFPVGGCWIKPNDAKIYNKTKLVSTIASNKTNTHGQSMRHLATKNKKISCYGPSYKPLEYKLDALKEYQFHLCIENYKNNSYFTEKIIDCFATGTIPIYWGCSNISNFFNTRGIIEVDDINEINYVINNIGDFIIDKKAIIDNYMLSQQYWLPESRLSVF